jgi:hypothetical protein
MHGTDAEEGQRRRPGLLAVSAMDTSHGRGLGLVELRRAAAGPERVVSTSSAQKDRIGFFEFIFKVKTIPAKSSNCFNAPKILGKSQKVQENS